MKLSRHSKAQLISSKTSTGGCKQTLTISGHERYASPLTACPTYLLCNPEKCSFLLYKQANIRTQYLVRFDLMLLTKSLLITYPKDPSHLLLPVYLPVLWPKFSTIATVGSQTVCTSLCVYLMASRHERPPSPLLVGLMPRTAVSECIFIRCTDWLILNCYV